MTLREIEHSGSIRHRGRTVGAWQDIQNAYFIRMSMAYYYGAKMGNPFYMKRYHRIHRVWNLLGSLSYAMQYSGADGY